VTMVRLRVSFVSRFPLMGLNTRMPSVAPHSPLLEPDVRISRIRLSPVLSPQALSDAPPCGLPRWERGPCFAFWPSLYLSQELFFRNGPCGQAELLPSDEACTGSGPLAPRALPRFLATMSRSDSRCEPRPCYAFQGRGDGGRSRRLSAGPPRFLDRSFRSRRPQPPRGAPPVRVPVASG
jgi:hypothetical protein